MIELLLQRLREDIFGFRETVEPEQVPVPRHSARDGEIGIETDGLAGFGDGLVGLPDRNSRYRQGRPAAAGSARVHPL